MSALSQLQSQQVQQSNSQHASQENQPTAATDISSFAVDTATDFHNSFGNQGILTIAGMIGEKGGGGSGLDIVSEIDPNLAFRIDNQLALASNTAAQSEKLLVGTMAEADLNDLYAVQDYIHEELDGIQGLADTGSEADIEAALHRLEGYERNLSSCVLIVDSERNVSEFYLEILLGEGLGLFCAAAAEVGELRGSAQSALSGIEAVEAELAKIQQAMGMLQDVALKAQLDIYCDRLTAGVNQLVGPLKGFGKAAMMMATKAASYTKDAIYEQLRNGTAKKSTPLEDAQQAADLLNAATDTKIPDQSGLLGIVSEANAFVKHIEDMKDAHALAVDGLDGLEREWKNLLHGPAPEAVSREDLAKRFASTLATLNDERDFAEDAASVFREQAKQTRSQFPDRAERLS